MWYVYIVECRDKTLYTGVTNDINRRIHDHNKNQGGSYTRIRTPIRLVYNETHTSRSSALKREAQIKRWSRDKKLALAEGNEDKLQILSKSYD